MAAGTRAGGSPFCRSCRSTRARPSTHWPICLDNSSSIEWWLRLRVHDPAYIELDAGGKYYPDFIAVDRHDVHWVIEGKSNRDADAHDVQVKKAAAEEWARFVNDDDRFGTWRYLFCTETAISHARGGWDALLVAAGADRSH